MVRTRHRRDASAGPAELWASAGTVRLRECRILGPLIRTRIPGTDTAITFRELFRSDPFNLLDEGPTHTLSGLCGRIWTLRRDFAELRDPSEFLTWDAPGTVRVLFAHWAQPAGDGRAALVSEVRIAAVDRRAALYVRGLQPFIHAFQGLVAVEPLTIATRRAGAR